MAAARQRARAHRHHRFEFRARGAPRAIAPLPWHELPLAGDARQTDRPRALPHRSPGGAGERDVMAPLSTNIRRAAALAILALLLLLVVFGIAAPIMEKYELARGTGERLAAALARADRSDEDVAALEAELASLKERRAGVGEFLQSANEALAAAELQNRIKSAVEAAQGELRSTQILAVREEGQFRQAAVRGQIVVKLKALQRI